MIGELEGTLPQGLLTNRPDTLYWSIEKQGKSSSLENTKTFRNARFPKTKIEEWKRNVPHGMIILWKSRISSPLVPPASEEK